MNEHGNKKWRRREKGRTEREAGVPVWDVPFFSFFHPSLASFSSICLFYHPSTLFSHHTVVFTLMYSPVMPLVPLFPICLLLRCSCLPTFPSPSLNLSFIPLNITLQPSSQHKQPIPLFTHLMVVGSAADWSRGSLLVHRPAPIAHSERLWKAIWKPSLVCSLSPTLNMKQPFSCGRLKRKEGTNVLHVDSSETDFLISDDEVGHL